MTAAAKADAPPVRPSLLPRPKALVVRNVTEAYYLRPCYTLEMLPQVTTPIRTTAIPIGEAVLFSKLPGRYSPAGAAEDVRVGGEGYHRAAYVGRCLGRRKVRILSGGVSPRLFRDSEVVKHLFRAQEAGGQSQRRDLMLAQLHRLRQREPDHRRLYEIVEEAAAVAISHAVGYLQDQAALAAHHERGGVVARDD